MSPESRGWVSRVAAAAFRALLIVLGPALVLAACGGSTDAGVVEEVSPAEVLAQAADRMAELQGFAFTLEHENGFTSIMQGLAMERAEGRVAGGESMRADVTARAGPMAVKLGVVILPEESWITNPLTGAWQRDQLSIAQIFDPATGVPALIRDLIEPTLVGTETIGGAEVRRIDAQIASESIQGLVPQAPAGLVLPVRVWVGVDDPVVHRIELAGKLEAQDGDNAVRRLILSDFDADSVIAPPSS